MAIALSGMEPLLLVADFELSLSFYREVLGFAVASRSGPEYAPGWALLARDGMELMLNGARDQSVSRAPDPARTPGHRDAALYFGCRDLDGAWAHFRRLGIELAEPAMTGYGFRSLYLADPDGYSIVLHWPETEAARADWERRYGADSLGRPA